ncbi:MAG: hypothetical protein GY797_27355 [Deltaproteobacteria bacterium]|nr:hypothetical protein [Deltaproteobacteria bacterium]
MSFKKENHLDEDRQIRAIVYENKLPDAMREHLSLCPRCRNGIKKIKHDLNNLGQTAKRRSPVMHRKISLPIKKPSRIYRLLHDRRISFGAVAATAMVLFVVWLSIPSPILHEDSLDILAQVSWEDDDFMTEISALTENALPEVYLDIIRDSYSYLDDEFIQFVVPTVDTDSLSYEQERKGVKSC